MQVRSISLTNFRSFVSSGTIELGQLNVLVGANNTGKSSIIRALYLLQQGGGDVIADVRAGASPAHVAMQLTNVTKASPWGEHAAAGEVVFAASLTSEDRKAGTRAFSVDSVGRPQLGGEIQFPAADPRHFIVPFLSKRKAPYYAEDVKEETAHSVMPQMTNLAAKLSRVSNPAFPRHNAYADACKDILGVMVTVIASQNGQRPGIYLPDLQTVPIEQMGEGVPNIVDLLASLAVSEGKLFLIEEPENDLHPAALKALLDLIVTSSQKNQFVISTHSNVVVRHLCSLEKSKLYRVRAEPNSLPTTASIELVEPTPEARIEVLRDLGYELSDFELWDGWLILEESSAERIIRDFLIPWFAPKLSRVRTLAAGGANKVARTYEDFRRLFLFAHLERIYRDKAWVRLDGDVAGAEVVEKLRSTYKLIRSDRFATFSQTQFEHYYPREFADAIAAALSEADEQRKREAKKKLLLAVTTWLDEDHERGKRALTDSAKEVIDDLLDIHESLFGHLPKTQAEPNSRLIG